MLDKFKRYRDNKFIKLEVNGTQFILKKLSEAKIRKIVKKHYLSEADLLREMIYHSLHKPKLSRGEIEELEPDTFFELSEQISSYCQDKIKDKISR